MENRFGQLMHWLRDAMRAAAFRMGNGFVNASVELVAVRSART